MLNPKEKQICRSKVRYSNDVAAQAALKKINPRRKLKKPIRVYKCSLCSGYHLTSQSQR